MNVTPHRQRIKAADSDVPIILVVEDEQDNLLLICHILIFLKYNFITATKGQEAFDLATKYEIDLVLLDLVLPDIDGYELIEYFKQHESTRNMPIVAVSALVRKQDRDRALDVGCDDYLTKPYLIEDLQQKIRKYLCQLFSSKTFSILPAF